jgi:hypothetical protein
MQYNIFSFSFSFWRVKALNFNPLKFFFRKNSQVKQHVRRLSLLHNNLLLKGKYGRFLQLSSMPTEARFESVQFELPHEGQKNKKDKRGRMNESKRYLASTLFWVELNCMHISSSNRCYKVDTIVAGR